MPILEQKQRKKTSIFDGGFTPPPAYLPGTISDPVSVKRSQEVMFLFTSMEAVDLTYRIWVADERAEVVPDSELPNTDEASRYYLEMKGDPATPGNRIVDEVTIPAASWVADLVTPGLFSVAVPYDVHAGVSFLKLQPQGPGTMVVNAWVLKGSAGGF